MVDSDSLFLILISSPVETSSRLGLIGSKDVGLVIWPPTQLGLIGLVGSRRISRDILETRFDRLERCWFGHLATYSARFDRLVETSSRLGLIGSKDVGLVIWPPTQLGLIGLVGSRRISRDILETRFDRLERCWFGHLATYSARFDRLVETSSRLGLIGSKDVGLVIWPPTQLGLIGLVGSRRISRDILETRFDRLERCWFGHLATYSARFDRLVETSSRLGLIGSKDVGLVIWPPTQLGLIGLVGSRRISRDILETRFDRLERCWFGHLATYSARFDRLVETSSRLGLIGSKDVGLVIWPPTQLGLIGLVGSRRISRDILETRFDRLERCWFGHLATYSARFDRLAMSQLSEIPTSTYTPEMETLGAVSDIPTFDGEPVPVSWNPLTSGTQPLQLLPLPGTEFPVCYETSRMRGFQVEVDLGKARFGGSSTDASAFWDLLDPPMQARVIAAGFGDYAAGLCRTQPHFPAAMWYALMERWNDCTHTFVFGFGEMTLTPVDYAAITGLRFVGPVAPLDARYQTATLGAQLVRSLLGVTTQTRYTAQGCVSYEVVYRFWAERIRTRLAAWRELLVEARPAASAYTREKRDQAARSFLFYIISSQLLCTSQNKGDPVVLVCLRDLSQVESFDWATLALAHVYHGLDVWAYEYRIYLGGPSGDTPAESRRIPLYLAHCHHTYASGEDPEYWRSFLNDRELSDLLLTPWEGDAWQSYSGREVAELHTRSRLLMRGYWADRYYLGERVYDTSVAPAQRRVPHAPPRHMCLLEGMTQEDLEVEYRGFSANDFLSASDFTLYFSTRMQARLPEVLEYTQERKTHKTAAHYRAEAAAEAGAAVAPAGPAGVVLREAPLLPQLDPEHTTHVPAQRYLEVCQRFGFARSYIAQLYSERHERDLEIGRLQRHQSRQSSAVSWLQVEVDRLRTRLEVEGIPLDSSEEDDDTALLPMSHHRLHPLRRLLVRAGGAGSPASMSHPFFFFELC
ncbi:hypothetical protein JCGZ_10974 [Jatropha curcas]|uniref:Aminotransferase-like plant mobile domain-containing protein n=1 Tax=Jatropha curcas TaxID=180498 RepID=A0A067LP56_JATCU|nr:hypothetical protein JCGZ_10974 [Jatropha curcas]